MLKNEAKVRLIVRGCYFTITTVVLCNKKIISVIFCSKNYTKNCILKQNITEKIYRQVTDFIGNTSRYKIFIVHSEQI